MSALTNKSRDALIYSVALAAIVLAPLVLSDFHVRLLMFVGISSIVTLGLVVMTGISGQTSFGQAAFMGLGAYASAWLSSAHGISPWIGLGAGLIVSSLSAYVLGALTLRLSGHFLPVGTIAWGVALYYLLGNFEFLGRQNGLTGVPPISFGAFRITAGIGGFMLVWVVLVFAIFATANLLDSRIGRALRALRSNAVMAEAFGVDTARLKRQVFIFAALLASLAGWLYAHLLQFVNPSPFGLNAGLEYLFMAVVGGAASPWAAPLGATVLMGLKTILQDVLPDLIGNSGSLEAIVLGLLLIVLLQRMSGGISPAIARLLPKRTQTFETSASKTLPLPRRNVGEGALLDLQSVTKQFGGLIAVNNVSFELGHQEILGLMGPNGAGKSTCFDLITGIQRCTMGEIYAGGVRIDGTGSRAIARRGFARSFQHVKLIRSMSVLENVAIGCHMRSRKGFIASMLRLNRAEEAAIMTEARQRITELGLLDVMYERAGSLPLGKQRLVEIARALCAAPTILLLDEPAAGLRMKEKNELAGVLERLRQNGLSIILVEHNLDFLMRLADRLVVMQFGQVIEIGTPAQVTKSPAVIEAYLGGEP